MPSTVSDGTGEITALFHTCLYNKLSYARILIGSHL